jgi:adenylate cyclase
MLPLTDAARIAWLIAADETARAGRVSIEPLDLLIGACGVTKALTPNPTGQLRLEPPARDRVHSEWQVVNQILERFGADAVRLRRAARQLLPRGPKIQTSSPKISRSEPTLRIFKNAELMARNSGKALVALPQLLTAIFESGEGNLLDLFKAQGIDETAIKRALGEVITLPAELPPALISSTLDASLPAFPGSLSESDAGRRLAFVYTLPLEFGSEAELSCLMKRIVQKGLEVVPTAERAALLIRDKKNDQLLLKACLPVGQPAVSLTLSERAMQSKQGLIWKRDTADMNYSAAEHDSETGMYAPLVWQDQALGVICLETKQAGETFRTDDLQLLVAVAHHAAMAIANHQLQQDLQQESTLLGRLLTNYSPQVRKRIIDKAARGRLSLGGESSEVTILFSDIRGFTKLISSMPADEVGDMLNNYFSVLVDAVFRHDGTVDKFIGDAILAVFGSPEPDPDHHAKAVRAAMDMQSSISALNRARASRGQITCEMGIGVHCGQVLHGFIGTPDRMEFTVVGDPVNQTSRYCAGAEPGEVLISPELHQRVWRQVDVEACTIMTKHEGDYSAIRVKRFRPAPRT